MIPQTIVQTWKTRNIPEHWQACRDSIDEHMSHWHHRLLTDEDIDDFVRRHWPRFWESYVALEYRIQKVDAFRVCWLFSHGGLYLDLDFVIDRPLDSLFATGDLFLVRSGNVGLSYTNSIMASSRNHPFWLLYLDEIVKPLPLWALGKHWKVMAKAGPLALTRAVNKWRGQLCELPRSLILSCSVCNIQCSRPSNVFMHSVEGMSWVSWDTRLYNFVFCNAHMLAIVSFLAIVAIVVWFKRFRRG